MCLPNNMSRPQPPDPNEGLPSNIDAEKFLLGSILLDTDTHLDSVRNQLQPADFSLQKHQVIYRRMIDLAERGVIVDRLTLAEELKRHRELVSVDGLSYLASLDDGLPSIHHVDAYVRIIKDKSVRRRVIFGADDLHKRAMLDAEETDAVVAAGVDIFGKLAAARNHREVAPSVPTWPDPIHEDGFHGIAGDS